MSTRRCRTTCWRRSKAAEAREVMRLLLDPHAFIWAVAGDRALTAAVEASGFIELPVRARHASAVAELPALHRAPLDRLLIAQAQAQTEPLRLLSAGPLLLRYSELVVPI